MAGEPPAHLAGRGRGRGAGGHLRWHCQRSERWRAGGAALFLLAEPFRLDTLLYACRSDGHSQPGWPARPDEWPGLVRHHLCGRRSGGADRVGTDLTTGLWLARALLRLCDWLWPGNPAERAAVATPVGRRARWDGGNRRTRRRARGRAARHAGSADRAAQPVAAVERGLGANCPR